MYDIYQQSVLGVKKCKVNKIRFVFSMIVSSVFLKSPTGFPCVMDNEYLYHNYTLSAGVILLVFFTQHFCYFRKQFFVSFYDDTNLFPCSSKILVQHLHV